MTEKRDFSAVDTWVFDLDNTLYPRESGLGALMEPVITDFVMETTGLSRPDAYALQKRYLADHGLTLRGLMIHHGSDPDAYHARFHDIPLEVLARDEQIRLFDLDGVGRSASRLRPRPTCGLGGSGWLLLVKRLGSESFQVVRRAWPYCRQSGPVV